MKLEIHWVGLIMITEETFNEPRDQQKLSNLKNNKER